MRTQKENIPTIVKGLFPCKILECRAQLQLCWCQTLWFFAVCKCMPESTVIIFDTSHWFKNINITCTTLANASFVYTGKEIFPLEYFFFFSVSTYKMGSFSNMGPLVRNTFHQINITIWKDFKPILNMVVIFNKQEASGKLALPKTDTADLQVSKAQLCTRRWGEANPDSLFPWNLPFSKSCVAQ